ncbi:MAG: ribosomal protein S18-alanine N-acetyltransferase [Candidatus Thermoplasmatota archaeon]
MFAVIRLSSQTLTEEYNPNIFNYFYETFPQGFLVAEQNHKIIGFIVGLKIDEKKAKILMLSVHPSFRRKRIGTMLLKRWIKEIKKTLVQKVDLEVRRNNKEAIKFYQKNGFNITNTIDQFYQNGEDGYTMEKNI